MNYIRYSDSRINSRSPFANEQITFKLAKTSMQDTFKSKYLYWNYHPYKYCNETIPTFILNI